MRKRMRESRGERISGKAGGNSRRTMIEDATNQVSAYFDSGTVVNMTFRNVQAHKQDPFATEIDDSMWFTCDWSAEPERQV